MYLSTFILFLCCVQGEAQNRYIELVSSLLKVARSTETQEDTGKYKWIKAESDGNIFKITFNRPHRKNAFNYDVGVYSLLCFCMCVGIQMYQKGHFNSQL